MRSRIEKIGLVGLGLVAGLLVSLHFAAIADKNTELAPLPVEELRAFSEVFGRIKSDYVEPVSDKTLITSAINGMLSGLDPHSAYLDADSFKELQVGTQGEFGGLGIEVGMEDGLVKVISPIEDTPAFIAGVKSGDLIIKLDDTLVKGLTLNDAVKRMRGKPGSTIMLTILRKGESKPLADQSDARSHQSTERKIQTGGAGLRFCSCHPVSGAHGREPRHRIGTSAERKQRSAARTGARPAQRSGRLVDGCGCRVCRFPAQGRAGGLYRRPHRGCQDAPHCQPG